MNVNKSYLGHLSQLSILAWAPPRPPIHTHTKKIRFSRFSVQPAISIINLKKKTKQNNEWWPLGQDGVARVGGRLVTVSAETATNPVTFVSLPCTLRQTSMGERGGLESAESQQLAALTGLEPRAGGFPWQRGGTTCRKEASTPGSRWPWANLGKWQLTIFPQIKEQQY